jgi:hypothetical protein
MSGIARPTQQARARAPLAARGDDTYETPEIAVEKLVQVERFEGAIWEPAAGRGAIVDVLRKHGHQIVATDLIDHGVGTGRVDFLLEWRPLARNVVTNPPYKSADQFAEHACDLVLSGGGKVCLLLRLPFLAGLRRREGLFKRHRLSRLWVFSGRLPRMHRVGWDGPRTSSSVDFGWFIWDPTHVGPPQIGWL